MNKFTRVLISTACLVTSASVLAHGHKGENYKGEALPLTPVTIPNFNGGFEIGLGALYMRPTSSNLQYVTSENNFLPPSGLTAETENFNGRSIKPHYHWGFVLDLGYVFPNTGNDAQLNWMHLHDDGDNGHTTINAPTPAEIAGGHSVDVFPIFPEEYFLGAGDFINAKSKVKYKFDAVDLSFGQYINIGPRLLTRIFTGLRWARLENDQSSSYNGFGREVVISDLVPPTLFAINASASSDSTFNGIGPVFGVSANYEVGYGFGISGAFDAALLVGNISLKQHFSSIVSDIATGVIFLDESETENFSNTRDNVVAPAFDAKLGVNYSYFMNNGSRLVLELGYQATKYFDVIGEGFYAAAPQPQTIDFGLNGPYLTLNLTM